MHGMSAVRNQPCVQARTSSSFAILYRFFPIQGVDMADENYDVDAAVAHLNAHAHADSLGRCASYVRQAIAAGGIVIPRGPAVELAKNYGPVLRTRGFVEVSASDLITPRKGDIAVIQSYPGGNIAGHITMYNGQRWVSDFRQNDMWSGPGYRRNKPAYKVYRWQGEQ